jgi:hypothetical protein
MPKKAHDYLGLNSNDRADLKDYLSIGHGGASIGINLYQFAHRSIAIAPRFD